MGVSHHRTPVKGAGRPIIVKGSNESLERVKQGCVSNGIDSSRLELLHLVPTQGHQGTAAWEAKRHSVILQHAEQTRHEDIKPDVHRGRDMPPLQSSV